MRYTSALLAFALMPLGLASSVCDASSSTPYPLDIGEASSDSGTSSSSSSSSDSGDSSSSSSGDTSSTTSSTDDVCVQTCGNDSDCLSACYAQEQAGQCAAVGCSDDSDSSDSSDDGSSDPSDLIRRSLSDRSISSFMCDDSESCFTSSNGVLMCLDASTGTYHASARAASPLQPALIVTAGDYSDQYGGSGNVNDGSYSGPVNADGSVNSSNSSTSAVSATSASATASGSSTAATASLTTTTAAPGVSSGATAISSDLTVSTGAAWKLSAGTLAGLGVVGGAFLGLSF